MITRPFFIGLAVLSLLFAIPASAETPKAPLCRRLEARTPDFEALKSNIGSASAKLGFQVASEAKIKTANRIVSPWSLYAVLAQLVPGARGETEQELTRLLYAKHAVPTATPATEKSAPTEAKKEPKENENENENENEEKEEKEAEKTEGETATPPTTNSDSMLDQMADSMGVIACPAAGSATQVLVGNRIFLDKKTQVLPEYAKSLQTLFDTTTGRVNFAGDRKASAREINSWISKQTMKKIPQLVTPDQIGRNTKLVLANTLYLKAAWSKPFSKSQTTPGEFRISKRKKLQVPMMRVKGPANQFAYAKLGDLEALRTDLAGGETTFLVLLPEKIDGIKDLEKRLGQGLLSEITGKLEPRAANFVLPRFKTASSYDLTRALEKVGLKSAVNPGKADFTGIDGGTNRLFIGGVLQKVVVEVDEKGFEGAAATAALMRVGSAPPAGPPIDFIVDRPFLFLVQNNATGAVLFQGAITDPSAKE